MCSLNFVLFVRHIHTVEDIKVFFFFVAENIPAVADNGMPLIFRSFQEQKNNDAVHHYGMKALAMMSQSGTR